MAATAEPSGSNPGKSRYGLPAAEDLKPIDERLARLEHLINHYGSECIDVETLTELLRNCPNPVAYDGFEPSGRMHIAQGLMKSHFVNNLTSSGFTFLFWVADWFAKLNHKMGGDLEKIQTVGRYMIEIWKASGMDMSRVRFLWASEEFSSHHDAYWSRVLDISTKNTVTRVTRCTQIMGRTDKGLSASQIFYPCMQAADIFFLGVDVCQLGLDQRKVNMLAREYADAVGLTKPSVLSHPMLPGLKKGQEKMSKSMPDTAIYMEDTPADVAKKIKAAYCPVGPEFIKEVDAKAPFATRVDQVQAESLANPVLAYFRLIIVDCLKGAPIHVNGVDYPTFEDLRAAYIADVAQPMHLKEALTGYLNRFLDPIRHHFETDPTARALKEQVIAFAAEEGKKPPRK